MEKISISIVRIKMKLDVKKEDFNLYPIRRVKAAQELYVYCKTSGLRIIFRWPSTDSGAVAEGWDKIKETPSSITEKIK